MGRRAKDKYYRGHHYCDRCGSLAKFCNCTQIIKGQNNVVNLHETQDFVSDYVKHSNALNS